MTQTRKTVVIIGAGPAGLFAARALKKQGYDPIILEKEKDVGGKCKTYTDPAAPHLKTEWGAAGIGANYGVVVDAIYEKGIVLEELMDVNSGSVEVNNKVAEMPFYEKAYYAATLATETAHLTYDIIRYKKARNNCLPLPDDFELSYAEYARRNGQAELIPVMKQIMSAFGYGDVEEIPAYSIMECLGVGHMTSFALDYIYKGAGAVTYIKNGMQYLMERIAEDFNVTTSANVTSIERGKDGVTVTYASDGSSKSIHADALVLAVSPQQWNKLGMQLTATEQACADQLTYRPYAVAICKAKGLPPEQAYFPAAFDKAGFGKLSLITTRDNRKDPEDGRLCTAYANLAIDDSQYDAGKLVEDLSHQPGVTGVENLGTKVWNDYALALPWQQRLNLEAEQMHPDTNTLYVGAYPVGGFEIVHCVAEQATQAVNRHMNLQHKSENRVGYYLAEEASRALKYFGFIPRSQPVSTPAPVIVDPRPGK